jgi:hypothetical protein
VKHSTISIDTPVSPPQWALLQSELIRAQSRGCELFFNKYFDERGYLQCIPRWGGNDGADDAIENLAWWPILHTLGGCDSLADMCKLAWEGHIKQYTEAKTVDVPFCRDGMYFKEFPTMFDWLHNGESTTTFNLHGLFDPYEESFEVRVRRFAGFYMDEDPIAKNYDPEHKIIRSMFNGSRGPMLRKATALDWAGDPIEVEGRFVAAHGEENFEQMLEHFSEYQDIVGDHPLNLGITALALNAFALTGEAKYRDWLLEYVDAWVDRTEQNDGITPSNIGLDGTIGGECDGKWYGGTYGWSHSTTMPPDGHIAHRNCVSRGAVSGFGNALLLTGDQRYVDTWRTVMDKVNANKKEVDGQEMYPNMYGDDGWYNYTPAPWHRGALEVYYWSMNEKDRARLDNNSWIDFLHGESPDYPTKSLRGDFEVLRMRMEKVHDDTMSLDTRLSDNTNALNPAIVNNLVQQMLGGIPGVHGNTLHCRVRYFDPESRRSGLPEGVGSLVERLGSDSVTVQLVNLDPVNDRRLVIQGGAYAEHQFVNVSSGGEPKPVDRSYLTIRLAAGSGARLEIGMNRYANQPTMIFPWDRE